MDDPDAPAGTWVHWVLYDLPPNATGLPEDMVKIAGHCQRREAGNEQFWPRLAMAGRVRRPASRIATISNSTRSTRCST